MSNVTHQFLTRSLTEIRHSCSPRRLWTQRWFQKGPGTTRGQFLPELASTTQRRRPRYDNHRQLWPKHIVPSYLTERLPSSRRGWPIRLGKNRKYAENPKSKTKKHHSIVNNTSLIAIPRDLLYLLMKWISRGISFLGKPPGGEHHLISRDWGTNQIARKALFTCVVYTNKWYCLPCMLSTQTATQAVNNAAWIGA